MLIFNILTEAVEAQLKRYGVCGGNVESNRDEPLPDDLASLPHCHVFMNDDTGAPDADERTGPTSQVHTSKLVIEIVDRAGKGKRVRVKLNEWAEIVRAALLADRGWGEHEGGLIEGIGATHQIVSINPDGAAVVGRVQVIIDVLHRSAWPADASGLPDFSGLNVRTADGIGADIDVPTA